MGDLRDTVKLKGLPFRRHKASLGKHKFVVQRHRWLNLFCFFELAKELIIPCELARAVILVDAGLLETLLAESAIRMSGTRTK